MIRTSALAPTTAACSAHRNRELREARARLSALAEARHADVREELGEAPQTGCADRVQTLLELVVLPVRAFGHNVRPQVLFLAEGLVRGEREEGVLVEVALDEGSQRAEDGREERREGRDERGEGRAECVRCVERGELGEQIVLFL